MAPAAILWDVVEEHLDDAAFLSGQWERALVAPDYTLPEVAERLESRLFSHLDCLTVTGAELVPRLLEPRFWSEHPEDVFVAALVRCELVGTPLDWIAALSEDDPTPALGPVLRALELARRSDLGRILRRLLPHVAPELQVGLLRALAVRGEPVGRALPELIRSDSARVRAAALRTVREGDAILRTLAGYALEDPEAEVRDAALEAGLLLGLPAAMMCAREAVDRKAPDCPFALTALAVSEAPQDAERLVDALESPELRRGAVVALGFSGWRRAAEACLPLMEDEALARLAGEAFSRVTGLVLEGNLALPAVEPAVDGLDADLAPDPEKELPAPEAHAVARWWWEARRQFSPHQRYHRGQPRTELGLWAALSQGAMRGRDVLALELALRTHGAVNIQTRSWAYLQSRALVRASARP